MMPEIEKGVPIPEDRRGRKRLYPFGEMEVGDSFVLPVNDQTLTMYKMIGGYTRHLKPKKFTARYSIPQVKGVGRFPKGD